MNVTTATDLQPKSSEKLSHRALQIDFPAYHLGVLGWLLVDSACAFFSVLCASLFSPTYGMARAISKTDPHFSLAGTALVYAFLFPIVSHVFGLHNPLMRRDKLILSLKYLGVAGLSTISLALVELFVSYTRVGRHILVLTLTFSSLGMVLLRLVIWRWAEERKRRLILLGEGRLQDHIQKLVQTTGIPYELVEPDHIQCICPSKAAQEEHPMGCLQGFRGKCGRCGIHEVVVCSASDLPRQDLAPLSNVLMSGIQVSNYTSFIERTFFKVPVEQIGPDWFFDINTSGDYALYRAAKRMADLFLAALGLLLSAPLIAIFSLLIKLENSGPVFYSQIRVGQYGCPFRIWKLRSMRTDAERDGAQWAQKGDSRVTRIGRILRLTRLDELPQFFNVLQGDMSFVGPRPERPEFVDQLAGSIPFFNQRHLLKPGITGWAQINYPYGSTREDALMKLKYDLYYVKHASLLLDVQIALRTVGAVMKGAR